MTTPRALTAILAVLLGTGCGSDGVATSTTAPPASATTAALFPVEVLTDAGAVQVASPPQRIVSLSATHTEMLFAIGAGSRVVATDLTSNYPAAAAATAKLDSFNFDVEEVAALEPDLVVVAFDFQGEGEQLAALDIPFLLLGPPQSLEGMLDQLEVVGAATGNVAEATALTTELRARIRATERAAGPAAGATFYHEIDETLYTATSGSFLGDLYARLGMTNIADGIAGDNPFPQLAAEYILEQDPAFVFLGDAGFGVTVESVAARPGWSTLTAVTAGRVFAVDGDVAGRWGPRTVDLMEEILALVVEALP